MQEEITAKPNPKWLCSHYIQVTSELLTPSMDNEDKFIYKNIMHAFSDIFLKKKKKKGGHLMLHVSSGLEGGNNLGVDVMITT